MKGRVISNTGPMIGLSIIDRLDILNHLFDEVIVPDAVHQEMLKGGASNTGVDLYKNSNWIQKQACSGPLDPLLSAVLDAGEASVIQLSREIKPDYVLIDERKARKVAREIYQLRVIGTAGVLVKAKQKGVIKSVEKAFAGMLNGGYRIHRNIVELALKKAGEL